MIRTRYIMTNDDCSSDGTSGDIERCSMGSAFIVQAIIIELCW